MSNFVSFPVKLSGLIGDMMSVCSPSSCPSIASLYPLLTMILRFFSLYVLCLSCTCFCSSMFLVLGSWSCGLLFLLPFPPCGLGSGWLFCADCLGCTVPLGGWWSWLFSASPRGCSLVFWGGGSSFRISVKGCMF